MARLYAVGQAGPAAAWSFAAKPALILNGTLSELPRRNSTNLKKISAVLFCAVISVQGMKRAGCQARNKMKGTTNNPVSSAPTVRLLP